MSHLRNFLVPAKRQIKNDSDLFLSQVQDECPRRPSSTGARSQAPEAGRRQQRVSGPSSVVSPGSIPRRSADMLLQPVIALLIQQVTLSQSENHIFTDRPAVDQAVKGGDPVEFTRRTCPGNRASANKSARQTPSRGGCCTILSASMATARR